MIQLTETPQHIVSKVVLRRPTFYSMQCKHWVLQKFPSLFPRRIRLTFFHCQLMNVDAQFLVYPHHSLHPSKISPETLAPSQLVLVYLNWDRIMVHAVSGVLAMFQLVQLLSVATHFFSSFPELWRRVTIKQLLHPTLEACHTANTAFARILRFNTSKAHCYPQTREATKNMLSPIISI